MKRYKKNKLIETILEKFSKLDSKPSFKLSYKFVISSGWYKDEITIRIIIIKSAKIKFLKIFSISINFNNLEKDLNKVQNFKFANYDWFRNKYYCWESVWSVWTCMSKFSIRPAWLDLS